MIENRSMPAVSVIPELVYHDVGEACEWLCRVFGFRMRWRAGGHRAQLAYGDGALIVAESRPMSYCSQRRYSAATASVHSSM